MIDIQLNQGAVISLGSNEQGHLYALSLKDQAERELLHAPGPFVIIDGQPVIADDFTNQSIRFSSPGIRGEIAEANGLFRVELINPGHQALTCRIEVPVLSYRCSGSTRVFNPHAGGRLSARPDPIAAYYPAEATICALFFAEFERTTFGFGYLNREQRRVVLENGPVFGRGWMRGIFERLTIQGGGSCVLPPLYITVGNEWDQLIAPYTHYAQSYPDRLDTPAWVTETPWIFRDLPIHPFGMERFDELKQAIDDGFRYADTIGADPVFWMTPWWRSCDRLNGRWYFDHVGGDFTSAPEIVERVVEEVHRRGARIVAYTNVTAIGEYSDLFQQKADVVLVKNEHGGFSRNMEYPMFLTCPASLALHEQWDRNIDFMFGKLAVDGIFLDQAGGGYKAPYCYNADHGHDEPDSYGLGILGLLDHIRRRVKSINPLALIFGELAQDARNHLMDFWLWHWSWSKTINQTAYSEGASFFKHVIPDAVLLDQSNYSYRDEEEALRAVGRGVWLNVFDTATEPDFFAGCWEYYRRHRKLLQTRPIPLPTDSPDVAALLFGPVDGTAIIGILQPRGKRREVGLRLPPELGGVDAAVLWRPLGAPDSVSLRRDTPGNTMVPLSEGGGVLELSLGVT